MYANLFVVGFCKYGAHWAARMYKIECIFPWFKMSVVFLDYSKKKSKRYGDWREMPLQWSCRTCTVDSILPFNEASEKWHTVCLRVTRMRARGTTFEHSRSGCQCTNIIKKNLACHFIYCIPCMLKIISCDLFASNPSNKWANNNSENNNRHEKCQRIK